MHDGWVTQCQHTSTHQKEHQRLEGVTVCKTRRVTHCLTPATYHLYSMSHIHIGLALCLPPTLVRLLIIGLSYHTQRKS